MLYLATIANYNLQDSLILPAVTQDSFAS